ncbi:PEP-CTERM sorting domain-containing protein [Candidatus Poribacteria bacterium]|nr:PEP-CTERM sorting domain-containing protein [Candidatus Poribacteria bacterium]
MKKMLVLTGLVLIACFVITPFDKTHAEELLGTGTNSLLGGDLTDPENDGAADADEGYNAKFSSNNEPGFGGGEFSFNVFDNILGGGNAKWCCGPGGGIPDEGLHITAEFDMAYVLTHFTVSSANDVPARDPTEWEIQGSNDGEDFTTIYARDGDTIWTERLQVARFDAGEDFDVQKTGYKFFRFVTFNTASNPNGAYFQVGEVEYFGVDSTTDVDPKAKLTTTWGSIKNAR